MTAKKRKKVRNLWKLLFLVARVCILLLYVSAGKYLSGV